MKIIFNWWNPSKGLRNPSPFTEHILRVINEIQSFRKVNEGSKDHLTVLFMFVTENSTKEQIENRRKIRLIEKGIREKVTRWTALKLEVKER